ncbi:uncharacterized protein LOC131299743 [Rhododendron vialii]|uniref:uncharacterized protein LOC131299743 n=1 Tax=Rhododendron vialii TaxID=182163 RepID=UPI00265EDF1B|nr:uncharacterized protein LOC131299743 [Rhododendron vialii]
MHILKYEVNQSDLQTLRNVTESLLQAKTLNVAQVFLPSDVKEEIDKLNEDLNTAGCSRYAEPENKLKFWKNTESLQCNIRRSGWLLVAVTFILCGGFASTQCHFQPCMAMGEWVDTSQAETTLSNILPYTNPSQANNPRYYNQSGPSMPPLCYPDDNQLQVRQCTSFEVSMANASLVWQNFTCKMLASGLCTRVGSVTPEMYGQLVAAVNVSVALQLYAPPLLSLQDCNFVRDTLQNITSSSNYCPPLEHDLQTVNAALALISVGIMLCLALWRLLWSPPEFVTIRVCIGQMTVFWEPVAIHLCIGQMTVF